MRLGFCGVCVRWGGVIVERGVMGWLKMKVQRERVVRRRRRDEIDIGAGGRIRVLGVID